MNTVIISDKVYHEHDELFIAGYGILNIHKPRTLILRCTGQGQSQPINVTVHFKQKAFLSILQAIIISPDRYIFSVLLWSYVRVLHHILQYIFYDESHCHNFDLWYTHVSL